MFFPRPTVPPSTDPGSPFLALSFCKVCEVWGREPRCWSCDGDWSPGAPVCISGGNHRHDPGLRSAAVAGQSVYVTEEAATLI